MRPASAATATRTRGRSAMSDNSFDRGDEVVDVHAEELVDVGGGRGFAEAVDAHYLALQAHVLAPVIGHAGFDRHARDAARQHEIAPFGILAVEDARA